MMESIKNIKTHIVAAQDTNDFAVAVQLAEYPLLHVLDREKDLVSKSRFRDRLELGVTDHTFFNSG